MPGKIGVLTFHKCINYGSYWQARCLVEGLRASGHDAVLLDHHCDCVIRAELRCAFQPKLPERTPRKEMRSHTRKIRRFVEAFAALPQTERFSLHQPEAAGDYDAIVVGSDEVWNLSHPWYGGKPIFYGVGLSSPRLVSYAASFGSYSCHWGIDQYWADQLERFAHVSVRDENSYWLVRGSTGREPEVVLDPCLQFPQAIEAPDAAEAAPYALIYGNSFPAWLKAAAKRWSEAAGVRLLSVGYGNDFADEQRIDAGPHEFAALVAGAQAVITNFFHGCVFALLNGKPFAVAISDYRLNKVRDLTAGLGATQRVVEQGIGQLQFDRLLSTPPAKRIADRLAELRQRSDQYLNAALS